METFIGMLAGGAITFLASWLFYRRSSEDLRREAADLRGEARDLRRYVVMLLHLLDDAGVIDVEWNPVTGEPARVVKITLTAQATGQASHSYRVIPRGEQGPPEEQRE
jgi:hypothetical protein